MSLPVLLQPHGQESLSGFLMRVSQRNVVPNAIQLLRSMGVRPRVVYGDDDVLRMAQQLSIPPEKLTLISPSQVSHNPLLRARFQRKRQMVCGDSESRCVRRTWNLQR